jgi:hypothetical protein
VCSLLVGPPPSGEGPAACWGRDAVAIEAMRGLATGSEGFARLGTSAVKLSVVQPRDNGGLSGRTYSSSGGSQALHSRQQSPAASAATQRASWTNSESPRAVSSLGQTWW